MKIKLFAVCVLVILANSITAYACWDVRERSNIEGFSELSGTLTLSFKDSIDCKPVENATLRFAGKQFLSDKRGYVELPMAPFSVVDAQFPIIIEKSGYSTLKTNIEVAAGTVIDRRFALSRKIPLGKLRFVLQWDEDPADLDLHLIAPSFHISYQNMHNSPNKANLDRDARAGFGPETITLHRIMENEVYTLWVKNYSKSPSIKQHTRVFIYTGNGLNRIITLPPTDKQLVKVLEIRNRNIETINKPLANLEK